jgi:hypothetical protein
MTLLLIVIQALSLYYLLVPGGIDAVMPFRVVIATLAAFWIPGWLLWRVAGGRTRHWLEAAAVGILGSAMVISVLALAALTTGVTIAVVSWCLAGINAALTALSWRQPRPGTVRLWTSPADALLAAAVCFFCFVAFRWGDDVRAVGWEAALHIAYVRQYASGLPLSFGDSVLRPPEIAAQNYFYLWEFMLAVVARFAHVDAMVAALKARWCIPLFGFAAFFFMVQRFTASTSTALRATWVMVAAVATQFLTLAPNAYDIYIQSGPLRHVGAFFGSIHHSDSAMELLLPLLVGCLFWALRRQTLTTWIWFCAALAVAFFWHPREYFQVMWYGGLAIAVDIVGGLAGGRWPARARAYGVMVLCYLLVAAGLYFGMPASIRDTAEHSVGISTQLQELQKFGATLGDWTTWKAGSGPFSFHLHGYEAPGIAPSQPMPFSWLVLALPAALVLAVSGRRATRWAALYLLVAWLLSMSSYKFEQLMQAITYHEILISKPRLVHLFAYMIIGLGWSEFVRLAAGRASGVIAAARIAAFALAAGIGFSILWQPDVPSFAPVFARLNIAFFVILAVLVLVMRGRPSFNLGRHLPQARGWAAGLAFVAFAMPAAAADARARWTAMLAHRLDATSLFAPGNPVALAPDTLRYLQASHPPRTRVLVEPNQPHMVGIYAPVYVLPLLGNIGADMGELQEGQQGSHAVFGVAARRPGAPLEPVKQYLAAKQIAYVVGSGEFAAVFRDWVVRDPAAFAVAFESSDRQNVVMAFTRLEER